MFEGYLSLVWSLLPTTDHVICHSALRSVFAVNLEAWMLARELV